MATADLLLEPTDIFPELGQLAAAVRAGDWPAVSGFLRGIADPTDRSFAVRVAGEIDGAEAFLTRVAEADPADPLAQVLLAEHYIWIGWSIRSTARAQYVSREQFEGLHRWLRRAEPRLIDVTARFPDNTDAWNLRLTTARGLELGQAEARRRYDRLARHAPHHLRAQLNLQQQLCPKWSGSWEAMHAFTAECVRSSPPGSPNGLLVPLAHTEHAATLDAEAEKAYLADPAVHADVRQAAAHSVLHPAYRGGYYHWAAHNYFAAFWSLCGRPQEAAVHFHAVGNRATEMAWYILGDPATQFTRHRAAALGGN